MEVIYFHIVKKKETDDYGEETEKEITMMKKMLDKDSSMHKALEIQTYLIRKVHDYYVVTMTGYHNFINKYPEYSPYEMPKDAKKYKSPQAVDVDYNDSLDDIDLYKEKVKNLSWFFRAPKIYWKTSRQMFRVYQYHRIKDILWFFLFLLNFY